MDDLEERRQRYIEGSGLGEALLPPVGVGECEVSLHRQVRPDPLWALMERDRQDSGLEQWSLFSFPDETDDDPQGEPSALELSAPRGEVPEALREVWGDRPPTPPPPADGDIRAVAVCPDGSVSQGGPVTVGVGFSSGENGVAMYGVLPPGASSVEVTAGGEAIPIDPKNGLFLVAIPSGVDVTVIYRGPDGQILEERRVDRDRLSYS